ncbi:MAG TPA: ferric reductase-like transmembrane domain-containing protein, partial [Polyangiaceae bacterium]
DREKLLFAFRLHDDDGDGTIVPAELVRMLAVSLAEDDVMTAPEVPERLSKALFAKADVNGDGRISFEELEAVVAARPELLAQMTRSEARWIAPNEDLLARLDEPKAARSLGHLVSNRRLEIAILGIWAIVNVALFVSQLLSHPTGHGAPGRVPRPTSEWSQLSRACTTCINVDAALIVLPVLRRLLTWVRKTWLGHAVPVDEAIPFHRIVGHALFAFAVGHGVGQLGSYASGPSIAAKLLTTRALTGVSWLVVFAIMWLFSLAVIRRTRHFELFYFTHLLYVAWFAIAIFHAPSVLLSAALPLFGLAVEQALRWKKRAPKTPIVASQALRSGVTRLELQKPEGFTYGAGDYVFLRIPAIARHEWHPFTLSSAPEAPTLTVHVRSLGNWTAALRRRVEQDASQAAEPMVAYVDGPYGSPSAHVFTSHYPVLIGAGIGVTPFASILESLVLRAASGPPPAFRKAHFFWLNRDQYSFEWFAALLSELEKKDHEGLLDLHICMTGGHAGGTALGLQLARELDHAAGERDLVTGLRTMTHMGQPDWEAALGEIAREHAPDRVDVFFCGPPGLGRKLRPICARLGMGFREERF